MTLALNPPVAEDTSVTLFYEPPGDPTKRLQSAHGAEVEAIPGIAVRNLTDTVPVVVSAAVQEAFVTLAFDQALETSVNPDPDAFSLAGSDRLAIAATLRNDAVTSLGVVSLDAGRIGQRGRRDRGGVSTADGCDGLARPGGERGCGV